MLLMSLYYFDLHSLILRIHSKDLLTVPAELRLSCFGPFHEMIRPSLGLGFKGALNRSRYEAMRHNSPWQQAPSARVQGHHPTRASARHRSGLPASCWGVFA